MPAFSDTKTAFAYKSTSALRKAAWLFTILARPSFIKTTAGIVRWLVKWKIPFIRSVVQATIFPQFVGGETLEETAEIIATLDKYNVQVVLDYGIERSAYEEKTLEAAAQAFIATIRYASLQHNTSMISLKISAIARDGLLEKINQVMQSKEGALIKRYVAGLHELTEAERQEWNRVKTRIVMVAEVAFKHHIGILVDAEESWIQDPIDVLAYLMMDMFNGERAVVFNTLQMYRADRLSFLEACYDIVKEHRFILGIKLVRGAYMEKERIRAWQYCYPSPIVPDKAACDAAYNAALEFCLAHLDHIALVIASHNEESNMLAIQLLERKGLAVSHPRIFFAQLYGMGDHITFNLAKEGCHTGKYLPYGSVEKVIPYLIRRAEENSSTDGQAGRELALIRKELERRKTHR